MINKTFVSKKGRIYKIVSPTIDRLDDILRFANKLAKEGTFLSFHPGKVITREDEEKWLNNLISSIKNGSSLLFWAILDGKIVGSVDIHRGNSVRDWHVGTVGIMVDSDLRGEGLGQFLLEYILSEAKNVEIRTAKLDLFADNKIAYNLYKKVGFIEYGLLPDGLYRKNKFSDRIYMYKRLI